MARASEYLDGELPVEARDRVAVHLARCPGCARYHRVLDRGLEMVRELPDIAPSSDFHDRLQHSLFHVRDEMARGTRLSPTGAALSIAVAGLIAFAAWSPFAEDPVPFVEAGVAVMDGESTDPGAPVAAIGGADPWFLGAPPSYGNAHAPPSVALAFPGPYSPLIIQPPIPGSGSYVQFTSLGLE
ncbi:MAG: anti-sigma factor family protein [Longimicrobiales bacterium]